MITYKDIAFKLVNHRLVHLNFNLEVPQKYISNRVLDENRSATVLIDRVICL